MKKRFVFALSALLAVTSLTACGGSTKLPTTAYEKVKFAFNGVEKSLKNAKTAKNLPSLAKKERIGGTSPENGLNTLYGLLSASDSRGDTIEELGYNEPPIIQFQYLKKVLEKIGNNYEFGTKYYENITGEMYVDMKTGFEDHAAENKYNYTFGLAIGINIDENDLISADVSFDINLTNGSESYHTEWYVGMELDYDMNETNPNYTLAMATVNDEKELPFRNHYTYEYDYADVKEGAVKEWRKFCLTSEEELTRDRTNYTFDRYEDGNYEADCFAWYKNNDFRKSQGLTDEQKKVFGRVLFEDLEINSTDPVNFEFLNKQGVQTPIIKTLYGEFSRLYGKDIIYDLVTREEYDIPQEEKKATSIKAMNHDLSGTAENYRIPSSVTIEELFNGFFDAAGEKTVIHLYYADKDGGLMDEITRNDFYGLAFYFKIEGNDEAVPAAVDGTLYDAYESLLQSGKVAESDLSYNCELAFVDVNQIAGLMKFTYVGELPSSYVKPTYPETLTKMGVPEYSGSKIDFVYSELENGRKQLVIKYSNADEATDYLRKLYSEGFVQSSDYSTQENETLCVKKTDDKTKLYIAFKYTKAENDDFVLTAWTEEISSTVEAVSIVGDFNNWDTANNCIEFNKLNNVTFMLEDVSLTADLKFKFVINHEWGTTGGIGFHGVENLLNPEITGEFEYFGTDNGPEGNILVLRNCLATFSAQVNLETNAVNIKLEEVKDSGGTKNYLINAEQWKAIAAGSMVNPKANYTCYMTHPVFNGEVESKYFYIDNGDIRICTPASYDPSIIIDEYYGLKSYANPTSQYVHYTYNRADYVWESENLRVHYKIFYKDCLGLIFDLTYDELTYNATNHCYECKTKLSYPYDGSDTAAKYTDISYYFEDGNIVRATFTYNNDQQYSFIFSEYGQTTVEPPVTNGN